MIRRRSLSTLLICTSLLTACVVPDDGAADDPTDTSTSSDEITFHPCAFVTIKLAEIANDAAATFAANGAPGWSVFVAKRVGTQTEPCTAHSSGGYARSYVDGYREFGPDVSFPIASQSKVITAVATVDILARNVYPGTNIALTPNSLIWPYLPSDWLLGPGVKQITFAELLTHKSGLAAGSLANGWGSDLEADLRLWLQLGVLVPSKPYSYSNSGMALLQMLAARVQFGPVVYIGDKLAFSGSMLATYVNTRFLAPHGIPWGATPTPSCTFDGAGAFAYPTSSPPVFWGGKMSPATDYARCGFGRWNFTARNLALFLERLRNYDFVDAKLTAALVDEILDNDYGFDPTSQDYHTKGGLLPAGDSQFKSKTYIFPDGTVAVGFINSDAAQGSAIPDAYNAAMP